MSDDLLKALDEEAENLEELLKSSDSNNQDTDNQDVDNISDDNAEKGDSSNDVVDNEIDLLKAKGMKYAKGKGKEIDENEDEEDEDYEDEDEDEELGKSLDGYEDEEGDMVIDASPLLESYLKLQKVFNSNQKKQEALMKSMAKVLINLSKTVKTHLTEPDGEIPGVVTPVGKNLYNLQKSKKDELAKSKGDNKYHGFSFRQAKNLLLKSIKEGELTRIHLQVLEQGGQLTPEANDILLKSKNEKAS